MPLTVKLVSIYIGKQLGSRLTLLKLRKVIVSDVGYDRFL